MKRLPFEQKVAKMLPQRLMPLARGVKRAILYPSEQKEESTDPYEDVHRILEQDSPVIVDGGANVGRMTKKFIELFENPTVHAIEPVPQHIKELEKYADHPSIKIHEVALGADNREIEINVNPKSDTSSIFKTTVEGKEYMEDVQERDPSVVEPIDEIIVRQARLDSIVDNCDIIKLDLQGYELEALRGSERILNECRAIISEVSFVPLLDNGVLFEELSDFLYKRNFHLYNLYAGSTPSGQLRHGDALFLKESVYNNGEFEVDWFDNS
jgi:FkbM family methyltransferase